MSKETSISAELLVDTHDSPPFRDRKLDHVWVAEAIRKIEAEANRSADTHMRRFPLPDAWGIDLYLKDESAHPTGSLKHRLARSLFLYGLANGWISSTTTIVEASSGSTAISEAYFAQLLELPYVAVMPINTSIEKLALIESYGGECHLVDPGHIHEEARQLARRLGGHYMDQFRHAERATDWRGNNNIAERIFDQLRHERYAVPAWIVVGAGTGGTSATIGRYLRYKRYSTKLCVVDPEGSAFFESWLTGDTTISAKGSRIEGIGRPRVEASFLPTVIDRMAQVSDGDSLGMARLVREVTGQDVGGSTGTNLWGALHIIDEMRRIGEYGSVVTLICDGGERYRNTYGSDEWLSQSGIDPLPALERGRQFLATGSWPAAPDVRPHAPSDSQLS